MGKVEHEGLREDIPRALAQVKGSTILSHYTSCLKKMELYREKIEYGTSEWKKLTSHQKIWAVNEENVQVLLFFHHRKYFIRFLLKVNLQPMKRGSDRYVLPDRLRYITPL